MLSEIMLHYGDVQKGAHRSRSPQEGWCKVGPSRNGRDTMSLGAVSHVPAWRVVPLVLKAGVRDLRGLKQPFVNHYRLTITGH
jgi:hypothetical protein